MFYQNAGCCAFPLADGGRLVLSAADCLEVFLTVAEGMPVSFGRDELYFRMADHLGLGKGALGW